MQSTIEHFVGRRWSLPQERIAVRLEPLGRGLESAVALASVATTPEHAAVPPFVVKSLHGLRHREADVYQLLWTHLADPPTARVFGVDEVGDTKYLYLEEVRTSSAWPWSDGAASAAVCRALARFHTETSLPRPPFSWDYEAELAASANATLSLALTARDERGARWWPRIGDLRRVIESIPYIRAVLLAGNATVIHGDVHPGNVIVRSGGGEASVVFIDWGRARIGSPLEDVASWLQSLGCWEPQARRRHDSLLRVYLTNRIGLGPLTAELRRLYWLASASNGLAGAIRYHLAVLGDSASSGETRYGSFQALKAWTRVIRRAASLLSTSRARCR